MRCFLCKKFIEEDKSITYRKCLVCNKFYCYNCYSKHVLTHILQLRENPKKTETFINTKK